VTKKRRDIVATFAAARELAESVLSEEEAAGRAERLTAGLSALWPAPLTAALLAGADQKTVVAIDEARHRQPDWEAGLRLRLAAWLEGTAAMGPVPLPVHFDLPEHTLHGAAIRAGSRRYGVVALALHKRTADAALAQALLSCLAEHLGFRIYQTGAEWQAQGRYRDLADLTNLVGHEFNNALNSVGLQIAALAQKGLTSDDFPELAEIRKVIPAAGRMVRRLQELCYEGAPSRQPYDLNRAVRAAAADPGVAGRVGLELEPDLPLVQGSRQDLERLAGALLRGAALVSGDVAILARTGRGPGTAVWLSVEDRGPDPAQELLPQLFEPFLAVREGDDGQAAALAKAIARRIGGSVRGERRAGGGMVFVAELRPAERSPA
jgi:signal transduction histidine kinase